MHIAEEITFNIEPFVIPEKLAGNFKCLTFNLSGSSPLRNNAKENNVMVQSHMPRIP